MNRTVWRSRPARTLSFFVLLIVALMTAQLALAPPSSAQNPNPSTPAVDGAAPPARLTYPDSMPGTTVDDYFGTKVADPYRWLEDDRAPAVERWVEAQNKVTFAYLDKIPYRQKIKDRLTALYNYPKF